MRAISLHKAFIPAGAPPSAKGLQAVSAQAGARWIEAYDAVTTKNKRYVPRRGCATVEVADFFKAEALGAFLNGMAPGLEI